MPSARSQTAECRDRGTGPGHALPRQVAVVAELWSQTSDGGGILGILAMLTWWRPAHPRGHFLTEETTHAVGGPGPRDEHSAKMLFVTLRGLSPAAPPAPMAPAESVSAV